MSAIVDAASNRLRCEKCGDEMPIPLGNIPFVAGVMELFSDAHFNCNGIGRKTHLQPDPVNAVVRSGYRGIEDGDKFMINGNVMLFLLLNMSFYTESEWHRMKSGGGG